MDKTQAAQDRYHEMYNQMLGAALKETPFVPPVPISADWYHFARVALSETSPYALHIKPYEMAQLWEIAAGLDMTLEQFMFLNNQVLKCTMVDFGLKSEPYFELMNHCADLSDAWNEIVNGISKELEASMTQIAHNQQRSELTGGPMNIVNAQA